MHPRRVLIDTDISAGLAGAEIDDAAAIIALVRDPDVDVTHITTVFGNATVATTTAAAIDLLDRLAVNVQITAGADAPLDAREFTPPWESDITLCNASPNTAAAHAIIEQAEAASKLTIVALGPLTNLALALHLEPGIVHKIDHIYAMGGNRGAGEFNFDADPAATGDVLNADWPITLFGLDVTNNATFTAGWFHDLRADAALDLLKQAAPAWIEQVEHNNWHHGGCALHDAVPAAYLTDPAIATVVRADMALLSEHGIDAARAKVNIATALDSSRFIERLTTLLNSAAPHPG